jgi:hypothetical protein
MTDFLTILPNLSIGVISVLALVYVVLRFLKALDDRADKHELAMQERETAMRSLEASVRQSMAEQLTKNTIALSEVTKVLARVVRHLDGDNK